MAMTGFVEFNSPPGDPEPGARAPSGAEHRERLARLEKLEADR